MTKDRAVSLRMDSRLYACAREAHLRFNKELAEAHNMASLGLSFNAFLEICINEYLHQNVPDLHRVAFDKEK